MTLQSIMIGDVAVWFADDKPGLGWWHGGAIRSEADADGTPTANLIEAGEVVIAQCGALLCPKPENSAALVTEFARQLDQSPEDVILSEAGLNVSEARLELRNPDAEPEVLARSTSSGMFPFKSLFNATLMGDQATRFSDAIAGEGDGQLIVVFDMLVELPFAVAAIESRAMETPDNGTSSTSASILASFGSASGGASDAARITAEDLVDTVFSAMTTTPVSGTASAGASFLETGTNNHPIEITTDAARWFAAS